MSDDAPSFDEEQARRARLALRDELGLEAERFELPALVNMISDEIGQLREAGRGDDDIAGIIERATGERVDPAEMARHYVPPEARRG